MSRLGGDEFAVVLHAPEIQKASATLAKSLIDALKVPLEAQCISIELGVSVGIAFYPSDGADAEALLKSADVAMYNAKRAGGGFSLYDAEHDKHSVRRLGLIGELRAAIQNDEITLSYQPKIDMRTGKINGAEALLRWEHESLGRINPEEFMTVVEATDLIQPLTDWTLSTAIRQLGQ